MTVSAVMRENMTEAEWQIRCDLAALYRVCDLYGWTDTIETHLSVRIPGEPNCLLINNYGELFHEVTASSLVKMDFDGNIFSEGQAFNPAGKLIHSGVYKARPDVNCIMHTHTNAGIGVAMSRTGLRPICQSALEVYDEVAYHDYGSLSGEQEGEALGASCKKGESIILRNHGLLTVGPTIPLALRRMYMLNRACELELIARGLGEEPNPIDPEVIANYTRWVTPRRSKPEWSMPHWHAALRQIEGRGTDWRQ